VAKNPLTPSWSTLIASLPKLPAPSAMPETPASSDHVKPYLHVSLTTRALHFSMSEIQSRMQLQDPHALDLEYTRTMMGFLLFKPEPAQITMIGLGGGSLAKFCHRYLRKARVEVVEINPHVIALRDEFQVPPDDERFSVVQDDGALFVRRRATRSDVLLVDGFDSEGLPPGLSSQAFYDDCCAMLQPDGILVANLHAGHPQLDIFIDRMRRSFDDAVLVIEGSDLGNSVVFAAKGGLLDQRPTGLWRPPRRLEAAAVQQLQAGAGLILTALKERRR
jgi:spermidine synthase